MRILALGVDHRSAPAAIREALAFDGRRGAEGLASLTQGFPSSEFAILSTCNRVEIYAAGAADDFPEPDALTNFLAEFHSLPINQFAAHLVSYHDEGAVGHLFRVAASLESLVLGEGQILGQVRQAFLTAKECKTAGPILHRVFEHALHVGKKVREATGMDQGKLSVASVAVDVARGVFDTFADKTVLVIGAGKMCELTLQHLRALSPGRILVTNRSPDRAEAAALKWGGEAISFERLFQGLIAADVVVSTTAADEPVVTFEQYARVQRARKYRLALILDIAIPRDFAEEIGKLDQVLLYNVDDLRAQAEENRKRRQKGIDPALVIIEHETAECYAALRTQRYASVVLRQLGENTDATRERVLDALFSAHPELTDAQRDDIAHSFSRFQNMLLHGPRSAVRTAAAQPAHEHHHSLLSAVRHLFGLADT